MESGNIRSFYYADYSEYQTCNGCSYNSRSVAIGAEDGIVVRSSQPDQKKIDPKIPNKEKRMTMAMWLDGSFGCDVFIV